MRLSESSGERTTAATDVLLSLVAGGGIIFLQSLNTASAWKIGLWSWSFGGIALSAGCGAAYHGLVLNEPLRKMIWQLLTLSLGMAISLFLAAVVVDFFGLTAARRLLPLLMAAGVLAFALSRVFSGLFFVLIVYESLALAAALAGYAWLAAADPSGGAVWMAAGVLASLAAAGVQARKRLRLRLIWDLDHNGVFHVIQSVGILLFCAGLSRA